MRSVFTRDERAVVLFLASALLVGSLVLAAGRVAPSVVPGFDAGPAPAADDASPHVAESGPVNVNTASAEELTRLPGVGPVRAEAIVCLRERRGRYDSLDELLEVKGIGPVTLERLRPEATVGEGAEACSDTLAAPGRD